MGEMAEATLNGFYCSDCGEVMDDLEEPGYPRQCAACAYEEQAARPAKRKKRRKRSSPAPIGRAAI